MIFCFVSSHSQGPHPPTVPPHRFPMFLGGTVAILYLHTYLSANGFLGDAETALVRSCRCKRVCHVSFCERAEPHPCAAPIGWRM
ncbi:hypothetical protein XELAEV_18001356mg [Xenopus laevis]|nr:hypothetical protein XELAEV_18001356mg [Xenopus laevis]